ncbi:Glycosyltransferase involved in cell wall bisynthesis [Chitinophaga terrae (ex Kim and Jung 2007)]|uniref:Glycosyltransferase involved in cell wall bisynthesis n=1 Tax=Chitinophaga terrae (ex Kim and Jung 2007) TaxID=408074 RepID=A0A1H3YMF5_9BACT|nr:glycosyltransferase family 1 protein [Chitinophaga terrae (ex Kim and Jung 2007)]MDQ0110261.1 glycosyltransferase involved in cell wall biosynthesis [Chitinophaga terrae (ex Kim and Jung 2007)]GEP88377.1 glycosyl transferase family 1 [Chitinophaga terrae (ex Kim and Jung 2007)]SEA12174.1 Glycosyltransferase involved in cell wall bisynthesis [Chitinophaga terrae (ex Kim and Jung 2007)]
MKIGFDAKRAFQNNTGLGNYSRTLISSLATDFPGEEYLLFAPRQTNMYPTNLPVILPGKKIHKWLKSIWRSRWIVEDLDRYQLDIFHGLSHELPFGIHTTRVRSVVTMHDLIFERYPQQYNPIDVLTYRRKARYACKYADLVVAISQQTKDDLVTYYQVPEEKIRVVYQSCDPIFETLRPTGEIAAFRQRYQLPGQYFLYVGSLIERKNLLGIVTAMNELKGRLDVPLVVLGSGKKYKEKVKQYLSAHQLTDRVIFLNEHSRLENEELPLLYQGAAALLYPSLFEGFGIPILEALWSGTPVITSTGSCFSETAGDAALYVDPLQPSSIAQAMQQIINFPDLAADLRKKGILHAQRFTPSKCAAAMMQVYRELK